MSVEDFLTRHAMQAHKTRAFIATGKRYMHLLRPDLARIGDNDDGPVAA